MLVTLLFNEVDVVTNFSGVVVEYAKLSTNEILRVDIFNALFYQVHLILILDQVIALIL